MLAGMTSIALLVNPATRTAASGGSAFLATAALLIPVLLLAVTIQGGTIQQMRAVKIQPLTAWFIISLVVLIGCAGEITAVITLYTGTASTPPALTVLVITIVLILVILAAAVLAFQAAYGARNPPGTGEVEAFAAPQLDARPIAEKPGTASGQPGTT